ncbi:MAG: histidine triad nucleotide-binding protein [Opitutae bacterium]|jgi:histidine triad (HIT) family protein|nr:histidine triad nucleotide-binding protein [Opitutae bacterium]
MKTIFEKIIAREIPADILHEDETCIVIRDIDPQAPIHCLVIPKNKIERIAQAVHSDKSTLGHLLLIAQKTAQNLNLDKGFRIVINNGTEGGESVPHLHIHLLGGRQMKWPPG